jgi:hypothetical protein
LLLLGIDTKRSFALLPSSIGCKYLFEAQPVKEAIANTSNIFFIVLNFQIELMQIIVVAQKIEV